MQPGVLSKLEKLSERFEELGALLSDAEIISDQNKFRDLSKEYARLEPLNKDFTAFRASVEEIENAKALASDDDQEMRELAREALTEASARRETLELALKKHLLPRDPHDDSNIFLEIRAGTGGDEAAIFAGDLFRMYQRYADERRYKVEILSESEGEHGGYREIITRLSGHGAYSRLKFESGAHRVQRVPETESQGRIHTSACTVAVLPEIDEVDAVQVNPADLRIDTYRASGAGGQHVNKTDSAIRITHLPTGIVVECQDERSQHKNRARAMGLLQARMLAAEQEKQQTEQAAQRKSLVGSGDRSERIRTYNYPQGRVTDHRIKLTLYRLDEILQGKLELVIDPLMSELQAEQMASLGQD